MNTSLHPDDISRFITGRIIGSLAASQVPWHGTVPGLPEHALTGEPFTGVNVLLLWQAMQQRSLHSGRWLTGDDLRQLGGQVRGGEKPVTLVRYRPSLSLFKVINLEQCNGLPDTLQPVWPLPPRPQPSLNVVRDLFQNSGIPVIHRDNILPVYRALHDRIELPPAAAYAGEQAYWQDILNLLVQATGHPQRLHRFGLTVDRRTDEVQEALVAGAGGSVSDGVPGTVRQTALAARRGALGVIFTRRPVARFSGGGGSAKGNGVAECAKTCDDDGGDVAEDGHADTGDALRFSTRRHDAGLSQCG